MRRWLRLAGAIDRLNEHVGRVTAWLVVVMVLLGAYNATVRYLGRHIGINLSSNAYIELQWYLFSLVFLFGASVDGLDSERWLHAAYLDELESDLD